MILLRQPRQHAKTFAFGRICQALVQTNEFKRCAQLLLRKQGRDKLTSAPDRNGYCAGNLFARDLTAENLKPPPIRRQ